MDLSGTKRLQAAFTQLPGNATLEGDRGLKVDDLKIKNLYIGKDNKIHVSITGFSRWQAARQGKATGEQALLIGLAQVGQAKGFKGAMPTVFARNALKQINQLRANPGGGGRAEEERLRSELNFRDRLGARDVVANTNRHLGQVVRDQAMAVHSEVDKFHEFMVGENLSVLLEAKELHAREFKGLNLKELVMNPERDEKFGKLAEEALAKLAKQGDRTGQWGRSYGAPRQEVESHQEKFENAAVPFRSVLQAKQGGEGVRQGIEALLGGPGKASPEQGTALLNRMLDHAPKGSSQRAVAYFNLVVTPFVEKLGQTQAGGPKLPGTAEGRGSEVAKPGAGPFNAKELEALVDAKLPALAALLEGQNLAKPGEIAARVNPEIDQLVANLVGSARQ